MTIEYLDLTDYLAIAEAITGLDVTTIVKVTDLNLADSALHAPAAGFGDTDFYPDFVAKAAVLVVRLARNHPLPDGNKRAAWVSLRAFVDLNRWRWQPTPSIDDAEHAMLAIADGTWDETDTAAWLLDHLGRTDPVGRLAVSVSDDALRRPPRASAESFTAPAPTPPVDGREGDGEPDLRSEITPACRHGASSTSPGATREAATPLIGHPPGRRACASYAMASSRGASANCVRYSSA